MPGPPPPPPPSAPPPPVFSPPKGDGPDDRSALLKSIRTGTKLKKTVTNDKSAPIISGKVSNGGGGGYNGGGGGNTLSSSSSSLLSTSGVANGMNLGGLFAGGMPKLRATGKLGASSLSNSTNNINNNNNNNSINNDNRKKPDVPPQPVKSFNSVQNELKKQMASDNRNRGPPPPAPIRNISEENGLKPSTPTKPQQPSVLNGYRSNQSSLHGNLQINNSTLHRKAISNANLTSLDNTDSVNGFGQSATITKPVINHGKPNLAPKPPTLNGKPIAPPKKLLINGKPVSRAHSMKSPRTPSPSSTSLSLQPSPDNNAAIKFGTVRNLSSVIGQSLGHSTGNLSPRPRPMLNGRPTAPPPSVPNHVPPPPPPHSPSSNLNQQQPQQSYKINNNSNVRPPNHAPPPPPPNIVLPQPPNHAPPLPPHRTQPTRPPPAKENYSPQVPAHTNTAPPPPPRQSSMRENSLYNQNNHNSNTVRKQAVDFDEKFKHMFHKTNMFPKPPPYRHVIKLYSNRQAISKQQAPQPPNLQTIQSRWDNTSAC